MREDHADLQSYVATLQVNIDGIRDYDAHPVQVRPQATLILLHR